MDNFKLRNGSYYKNSGMSQKIWIIDKKATVD